MTMTRMILTQMTLVMYLLLVILLSVLTTILYLTVSQRDGGVDLRNQTGQVRYLINRGALGADPERAM